MISHKRSSTMLIRISVIKGELGLAWWYTISLAEGPKKDMKIAVPFSLRLHFHTGWPLAVGL